MRRRTQRSFAATVRQLLYRCGGCRESRSGAVGRPGAYVPDPVRGSRGRAAELDAQLRLRRLVTICGVGGVGKSRLAAEGTRRVTRSASHSFPDGVCWAAAGAVKDPEALIHTMARALGLPVAARVDALGRAVSDRRVLLVLDNVERLTRSCASILQGLLTDCPQLSMLVTSRLALGLEFERVVDLAPFNSRTGGTGDGGAVALLVERAWHGHLTAARRPPRSRSSSASANDLTGCHSPSRSPPAGAQ